jgi:hypothetical protein
MWHGPMPGSISEQQPVGAYCILQRTSWHKDLVPRVSEIRMTSEQGANSEQWCTSSFTLFHSISFSDGPSFWPSLYFDRRQQTQHSTAQITTWEARKWKEKNLGPGSGRSMQVCRLHDTDGGSWEFWKTFGFQRVRCEVSAASLFVLLVYCDWKYCSLVCCEKKKYCYMAADSAE